MRRGERGGEGVIFEVLRIISGVENVFFGVEGVIFGIRISCVGCNLEVRVRGVNG